MPVRSFGGQARTPRSPKVFDFRRCDVLLPAPWTFAGGGGGTRRRVHGAVGPSRTALAINSATFSGWGAADTGGGFGSAVTAPDGTNTAIEWTFPTSTSGYAYGAKTATGDASNGISSEIWMRTDSGTATVNIAFSDYTTLTVGNAAVVNLTTAWQKVPASSVAAFTNSGYVGMGFIPGAGCTLGVTKLHLWHPMLMAGPELVGPYIATAGSDVTTTDWPRTNRLANPNTFNAVSWNGQTASVRPGFKAPDGSNTAWKFCQTASAVHQSIYEQQSIVQRDNVRYVFAKAAEMNWLFLQQFDGVINTGAYFDLAAGVVGYTGPGIVADMVPVGDGWWMCVVAFSSDAGATFERCQVALSNTDAGNPAFTGDGQSGIYIWRAKLEDGLQWTDWHAGDVVTPPHGELVTVAADHPRLEYDGNGVGQGVRVDGAFATTIRYTEELEVAAWLKGNVTPALGDYTALNLRAHATRLVGNGVATLHEVYSNSSTVVAGTPLKVVAKADGWSHLVVGVYNSGDKSDVCFNLATGTVGSVWSGAPAAAYSITPLEDGWYECSVTPSSDGFPILFLSAQDADSRVAAYSTGDGLTTAIQVARVCTGLGGYVFADSSAGAIAAEGITATDLAALGFNGNSGSVTIECSYTGGADKNSSARAALSLNSSTQYLAIIYNGGSHANRVYISKDAVPHATFDGVIDTVGARVRTTFTWDATGQYKVCQNGGAVQRATGLGQLLDQVTNVTLGSVYPGAGAAPLDGVIHDVAFGGYFMTDEEMVRRSTP